MRSRNLSSSECKWNHLTCLDLASDLLGSEFSIFNIRLSLAGRLLRGIPEALNAVGREAFLGFALHFQFELVYRFVFFASRASFRRHDGNETVPLDTSCDAFI